jgi:hypothetical protein
MEAYSYAITALLHCFTYRDHTEDASVSESEFVRFDLSYLRDLPEQSEKKPNSEESFGEAEQFLC